MAALAALSARLTYGLDLPDPVKTRVLDGKLVNAFTLPGGHVVFFDGLAAGAGGRSGLAAHFATHPEPGDRVAPCGHCRP